MTREDKIRYYITEFSCLVPFDDPHYDSKVRKLAENYVDNGEEIADEYEEPEDGINDND